MNATNSADSTPLHSAAGAGELAIVHTLLAAGADRNAKDEDGRTPGFLAASRGLGDVAAALS